MSSQELANQLADSLTEEGGGIILMVDGAYASGNPESLKKIMVDALRENAKLVPVFVEALAEIRAVQ